MVYIACGCAAHTVLALPVVPHIFRCHDGGLSEAHSAGRPPCTPRQCMTTREVVLSGGCLVYVGCCRLPPTVPATSRHDMTWAYTEEGGMLT